MAVTVIMPQMGESVSEGTVERWCVREGDRVEKDQILCEITTDKVDAEIPAPEAGILTQILVAEGQTVEVGAELALIDVVAASPKEEDEAPTSRSASAQPQTPPTPKDSGAAASEPASEPRATPLARRIAEERGIDLRAVQGSGVAGRVTKDDLLAAASRTPVAASPDDQKPAPGTLGEFLTQLRIPVHKLQEGDRVIPFSTVRRRVAEHMVVSKIVSPHVGTVAEVDLHRLVRLRERAKGDFQRKHGFKLTYLPFVVHATVRALRDFPRMNAAVVGESIVERSGIHVGVAVETEKGLLVPVIRDTDHLSLTGIARAIEDLSRRARARKISADELYGGTFTVTNPGREGNLYGFAVINQPQVGILRMGEVRKRPVVVEQDGADVLAIHPMMYLALSYDHRIIDGVTGNGFLFRVARYLEEAEFEV
ncbi:MAG: dihydrolipoamide acetyltransferase family protein [Myxococcota bacterium]